jgi:chorismate dehydratase
MLKLGCIEYINTLPLIYPLKYKIIPSDLFLIFDNPVNLNHKLFNHKLNYSFVSSVLYLKNKSRFKPLYPFGIAAKKMVQSVLLYTKKLPITEIAVTEESATSVELLKIICKKNWGVNPKLIKLSDPLKHDAFLIIGDRALKEYHPGYHCFDLASLWYNIYEKPFPFSLLIAQIYVSDDECQYLKMIIDKSLAWSFKNLNEVINYGAQKLKLPKKIIENYFNTLNYRFSNEEIDSLQIFETQLEKDLYAKSI